jgi:hypothetical protein
MLRGTGKHVSFWAANSKSNDKICSWLDGRPMPRLYDTNWAQLFCDMDYISYETRDVNVIRLWRDTELLVA